jgi:hypothetical protein
MVSVCSTATIRASPLLTMVIRTCSEMLTPCPTEYTTSYCREERMSLVCTIALQSDNRVSYSERSACPTPQRVRQPSPFGKNKPPAHQKPKQQSYTRLRRAPLMTLRRCCDRDCGLTRDDEFFRGGNARLTYGLALRLLRKALQKGVTQERTTIATGLREQDTADMWNEFKRSTRIRTRRGTSVMSLITIYRHRVRANG